ncbi:hypothetical protein CaCOL14_010516 [Colletotrichum acutatum]
MNLFDPLSSHPTAGGQYHFVAYLSPGRRGPINSWFAGYITTLGWVALAGSAPFLAGTQIQGLLILNYPDSYTSERWHGTLLYWAILLGSALVCIFCSSILPLLEKITMTLHIAFYLVILIVMAVVSPTKHSASFVFATFENNSGWSNDGIAWCIGLLSCCYVVAGYDGATHLSEEMENAQVGVPRAMVGCVIINGALGFTFLITLLFCMGDIESALNSTTGFPIIQIFYNITGSLAAANALTAAVTIMAIISTIPLITSAARVMWAFARDQGLPFSRVVSKVERKRGIPTTAIVVTTCLLVLLGLINIGSTTAFNAILSLAVQRLTNWIIFDNLSMQACSTQSPGAPTCSHRQRRYRQSSCRIITRNRAIMSSSSSQQSRRIKSRSGCVRCKRRRIKCDEAVPSCLRCVKSGVDCPGYAKALKWSTKHESSPRMSSSVGEPHYSSPDWFEEEVRNVSRAISHLLPEHQTTVEPPSKSASRSRAQESMTSSVVTVSQLEVPLVQAPSSTSTSDYEEHNLVDVQSSASIANFIRRGSILEDDTSSPIHIASKCASDFHTDDTLCERYADSTILLYEPLDQISLLLNHYFSLVCPISSSFDSSQSPFRSNVLEMMAGSRLLFLCVMNMSASHFHRDDCTSTAPLSFQTEAISEISTELCKINNSAMVNPDKANIEQTFSLLSSPYPVKDEVLLGIILLGMTSVSPMPISR